MKTCARCKIDKPFTAFSKASRNSDGFQSYCRECNANYRKENADKIHAQRREYRRNNPRDRDRHLLKTYNVSLDWYEKTLLLQGGCAICGTTQPPTRNGLEMLFHVDHDHSCCPGKGSCGKCVRGLLCSNCNFGIGSLKDSITNLQNAIRYLQEFQSEQ